MTHILNADLQSVERATEQFTTGTESMLAFEEVEKHSQLQIYK